MQKPWILFVQQPEYNLPEYDSINQEFNSVEYILKRDTDGSGKEAFLEFISQHTKEKGPIVGIFGGYPQFAPLGGLNASILNDPRWPNTIKCICLCSVGYNGIDLDLLQEKGIHLYNYDDTIQDAGIVANDVADCVLWHVLEGFRKFSSQMHALRSAGDTIKARSQIVQEEGGAAAAPRFEFGQRWKRDKSIESCRGKRCLIMGLGRIGVQCGKKLEAGLGMEIHYTQRNPVSAAKLGISNNDDDNTAFQKWQFHPIDKLVGGKIGLFDCIVICLPGTPATKHLIDAEFLAQCKSDVVICNVGRGFIIDEKAVHEVMKNDPLKIRHIALDVFHDEPLVEQSLCEDYHFATITPHIASSTRAVWESSNRLALQVLSHVCASTDTRPGSSSGSCPPMEPNPSSEFTDSSYPGNSGDKLHKLPRVI